MRTARIAAAPVTEASVELDTLLREISARLENHVGPIGQLGRDGYRSLGNNEVIETIGLPDQLQDD
jgi:hypothetical protein